MNVYESTLVKTAEDVAIRKGVTALELMERAAEGLCSVVEAQGAVYERRIAVFCGNGNNGGDGFAAARLLLKRGAEVKLLFVGEQTAMTAETTHNERLFIEAGGTVIVFDPSDRETVEFCRKADIIIDAIFGIGFKRSLLGRELEAARLINWSPGFVIAADLPTGVEADSALCDAESVKADLTVAFVAAKPAHFVYPAAKMCGHVQVCDIGVSVKAVKDASAKLINDTVLSEYIQPRPIDAHKGMCGKVLVIGGSVGLTGAPWLSAEAALRAGAGLVYLAVPESIYPIVAGKCDSVICIPFASAGSGFAAKAADELLELADKCDAVVLGPGLGRAKESDKLVCELTAKARKPLVLDADGINAISENINILRGRSGVTILTPHDVEFQRLGGVQHEKGRLSETRRLAAAYKATVLLKSAASVICAPNAAAFVNTTGNPGMAKGGSGDLLAGIVGAFIASGIDAGFAAACAAFIHGKAGDLAAAELGEFGMTPVDTLSQIPYALKEFNSRK